MCRICYLPPPKILRVLFSRWHWRRKHHTYILCVALITKVENETCITYIILPQSVVKRSCCMSKPQLHLDTQTDKFVFVNSIRWYCYNTRIVCLIDRNVLDEELLTEFQLYNDKNKLKILMTDVYKKRVLVSMHGHTSRNSLFPMARGAQLPCMSPYLGYTLGGPITWLADQLCKEYYETWIDRYFNVAAIPSCVILRGKSSHVGHPKFS